MRKRERETEERCRGNERTAGSERARKAWRREGKRWTELQRGGENGRRETKEEGMVEIKERKGEREEKRIEIRRVKGTRE